jgi:hypothetical protein
MRFTRSLVLAVRGAMDAANILKPALARGELRAIGATTLDEYQKYFERQKTRKTFPENNYRRTRYRKCNFNWYQREI